MNIKPLGDRVVVKPDSVEEKTTGGLYLASESKEKPQTGTVVAVGPGELTKDGKVLPMNVKENDHVLYGKYGGTEITVEGEDVVILQSKDIYAII